MGYKNREDLLAYHRQYRIDNKEKLSKQRKEFYKKNRKRIIKTNNEYSLERLQSDANYRVMWGLRTRLRLALKNDYKSGSAIKDLGCSIEFLKKHLESQFKPGMTWNNYGQWHIDHIKPLSSFDLTNRKQFKKACYYTNLQPLWAEENLSKGGC